MDISSYREEELAAITEIWNEITEEGVSFPGEDIFDLDTAREFFDSQTDTCAARENGEVLGFYILHPNNIGRLAHVANASYGVRRDIRGRGVGRALVTHCLENAKTQGFRGLQFNAVVATNTVALALYEDLGFTRVGKIPGGYRSKDGSFTDMYIFYKEL